MKQLYQKETTILEVIDDPVFDGYGRLLFPVDGRYYQGNTLGNLQLTWYNNIDSDKTVEIVNYLKTQVLNGERIFYDIYSEEEKKKDPRKKDTGLFYFKGKPGKRFAICNAGGGFAYVGAMHDSFPHALGLSKKGDHAFALIYRPGARTACEDLARAISFVFKYAKELQINTSSYSLWGGSAGARIAAYLGSYGPTYFLGNELPRPKAIIMQYTGHDEYFKHDPATFVCVGKNDGIVSWYTMRNRIQAMEKLAIDTEFHAYEGLRHGFGLGKGTIAEGWINQAISFWEKQM